MKDLALKIRGIYHVRIHQAEAADTCGGEIHGGRRTKRAGADEQDGGLFQAQLPRLADGGDEQVARVSQDFFRQQAGWHRAATMTRIRPAVQGGIAGEKPATILVTAVTGIVANFWRRVENDFTPL